MPGFVGIVSQRPSDECQRLVNEMVESLEHEDFYVSGVRSFPELGIYAGWVAMEGSFSSDEAQTGERDGVSLIFSGECFFDQKSPQQNGNDTTKINRISRLL